NRPDLMDPALKRAGSFDKKIAILLPDARERAEIVSIIINKYRFETDVEDFMVFAEQTESYTDVEIETVVTKPYELASEHDREGTVPTADIIYEAIKRCRPSTQQVQFMTMLAIEECDDKDLLPDKYKSLLDERNMDDR